MNYEKERLILFKKMLIFLKKSLLFDEESGLVYINMRLLNDYATLYSKYIFILRNKYKKWRKNDKICYIEGRIIDEVILNDLRSTKDYRIRKNIVLFRQLRNNIVHYFDDEIADKSIRIKNNWNSKLDSYIDFELQVKINKLVNLIENEVRKSEKEDKQ